MFISHSHKKKKTSISGSTADGRTHLTARISVFTAGITSSIVTSQYGLSSTLSSPSPSISAEQRWVTQTHLNAKRIESVCGLLTINRRTRFEAQGGAEACAVIEAPALLDLSRARGLGDVLLAGRAADTGARGQRRSLVPNSLGWTGIVHPDPIPKAYFTADSKVERVKHMQALVFILENCSFVTDRNVHAFDFTGHYTVLSCELREAREGQPELVGKESVSNCGRTPKMWPVFLNSHHIYKQTKQGDGQTFIFCPNERQTSWLITEAVSKCSTLNC